MNNTMPFWGEKQAVFSIKNKERKAKKTKTKKQKGGGPLGHLTWPLNPRKKKNKKQKQKQKNKKIRRV